MSKTVITVKDLKEFINQLPDETKIYAGLGEPDEDILVIIKIADKEFESIFYFRNFDTSLGD